ncbi:MAG TPA: FtsX-like permease family protein, partial [Azospirillaceae bacterium]|nr:FtsX-like permease family protein [Azospirillaceae bacterium]
VSGIGIEPASAIGVSRLADDMVAGSLDSLNSVKDGVVIGERLADRMNVAIGDTITAVAPSGQAARLRVVGRFRSSMEQVDRGQVYLSLPRQQALQNRPRVVNEIQIKMRDADGAVEAAAAMEARWGYKAVPWQEANERVLAVFVLQKAIIFSTVSAILVVASFGIFNIITTVVLEKSRDIAILRSIGLGRADIVLIFGFQGLVVSMAGTLAGFVLGIGLAELMGMIPAPGASDPTQTLRIAQPAWLFAAAAGIGVLTSMIAAWLPAAKAARADPLDIIRGAS